MTVLIVEDDPGIADVLEYALGAAGYRTLRTARGREAVARHPEAACIVLDVGLPDIDGFEVCRQIRRFSEIPILFLTSRSEEIDRVVGLELGGDDYLAKPFSTRELLARIKAIMRRTETAKASFSGSGLSIDSEKRTVAIDGRLIELSRREFDLLALLRGQPGRVFTREQILDSVWPDGGCVTDRTVDAHIKALRRALGDPALIQTVRGVGYRLREGV